MSGRLVVCPTPIGNLEDVTLRVLSALREADVVACEDTRRTRVLLDRYGVKARLVSYHEHNEDGAGRGAGRAHARRARRLRSSPTPACRSCPTPATCWCAPAWPRDSPVEVLPGPVGGDHRAGRVRAAGGRVALRTASCHARRASCGACSRSRAERWWPSSRRGGCRRRWRSLAELDPRPPGGGLPRADEGARGGRPRQRGRAGGSLRGCAPQGRGRAGARPAERAAGWRPRRRPPVSTACGGWWRRAPSRARPRRWWPSSRAGARTSSIGR